MVRNARSIRLCPHGMSGEQCFYSQLAMFVRQHNSFTDPVALRNIGKRNGNVRRAGDTSDIEYYDTPFDDEYPIDINQLPKSEDLPAIVFNKENNPELPNNSEDFYDTGSMLGKLLRMPNFYSSQDKERILSNAKTRADNVFPQFEAKSKRQIICPSGMPRVACYDNALAFYIQLMRTMNHKRFV